MCDKKIILVCNHVFKAETTANVLFCDDSGTIDIAACDFCANEVNTKGDDAVRDLFGAVCVACFSKRIGIAQMPAGGFWLRNDDGSYRPARPN